MFKFSDMFFVLYIGYKYVLIWIFLHNLQLLYQNTLSYNHFLMKNVLNACRSLTEYIFLEHFIIS